MRCRGEPAYRSVRIWQCAIGLTLADIPLVRPSMETSAWTSSAQTSRTALFKSWIEWTRRNGEYPGSARAFYENLEKRGFQPTKREGERRDIGLAVASGQVGAA